MYKHILVPLDGSTFAESALPLALGLAEKTRAVVHLVHVAESADRVKAMRAYLADVKSRVGMRALGGLETSIVVGEVSTAIEAYAAENESDIVVMATHGRGGVSRAWLGSVAEVLIATLPIPVLLQRPPASPALTLSRELPKKVFVPLERSEASATIIPHAELLATELGAELILATVIAPIEVRAAALVAINVPLDDTLIASRQATATRFLAEVAEPLRGRGMIVQTMVLMHHHAATAILQGAERANAEVIAMTTHARRGLARMVLGSTTDKVVRGTSKTMLLNRPEEEVIA
jgi:nucleotide-binding universal stress UspA family protein